MTYQQFVKAVERKVKERAGARIAVCVRTVRKNNGVERKGLLLSERTSNMSPTIYLEEYFSRYQDGITVDEIAGQVLEIYREFQCQKPWDPESLREYGKVRGRIVWRLIGRERNRSFLEETPHADFLDLAIVFYVLLEAGTFGTAAMLIREEHLDMWKVSQEEVYAQARLNAPKLLPYEFCPLSSVVEEMTGGRNSSREFRRQETLYVLSNQLRCYGAASVLYPGMLEEIGSLLGENYYVLPSSVHEIIVIRESDAPERKYLEQVVTEINRVQVDAEEVLSNRVYFYDTESRHLSL